MAKVVAATAETAAMAAVPASVKVAAVAAGALATATVYEKTVMLS